MSALFDLNALGHLSLAGNEVGDIDALSGLTALGYLNLDSNGITDLSPLVANSGLGEGDEVGLRDNPFDCTGQSTFLQELESRGAIVEADCP